MEMFIVQPRTFTSPLWNLAPSSQISITCCKEMIRALPIFTSWSDTNRWRKNDILLHLLFYLCFCFCFWSWTYVSEALISHFLRFLKSFKESERMKPTQKLLRRSERQEHLQRWFWEVPSHYPDICCKPFSTIQSQPRLRWAFHLVQSWLSHWWW